MKRSKYELIKEIESIPENIHIGNINDIKKEIFDTKNLYISKILLPALSEDGQGFGWQNSEKKYIFEKEGDEYIEIFTGTPLEQISLQRYNDLSKLFIREPIPYDAYFTKKNIEEELKKNLSVFENADDDYIDKAIKTLQKIRTLKNMDI